MALAVGCGLAAVTPATAASSTPPAPATKPSPPAASARTVARSQSLGTYWYVSLAASEDSPAPGQETTLTATANQDVGPTPYWIEIFDLTNGGFQWACPSGTTCSGTVAKGGSGVDNYVAVVSYYGTSYQPPGLQVVSNLLTVSWLSVSLVAVPYALVWTPTATATLTAMASMDVGPTPYYIEIFDYDTDTIDPIARCGWGTTCQAFPTQGAPTTHRYFATIVGTRPDGNIDIRAGTSLVSVTWFN